MKLGNGGEIHVRCFGRYNASLWDDIFAELPPLTAQDVIIINFGAWYPRFNFNEPRVWLSAQSCSSVHQTSTCTGTACFPLWQSKEVPCRWPSDG